MTESNDVYDIQTYTDESASKLKVARKMCDKRSTSKQSTEDDRKKSEAVKKSKNKLRGKRNKAAANNGMKTIARKQTGRRNPKIRCVTSKQPAEHHYKRKRKM